VSTGLRRCRMWGPLHCWPFWSQFWTTPRLPSNHPWCLCGFKQAHRLPQREDVRKWIWTGMFGASWARVRLARFTFTCSSCYSVSSIYGSVWTSCPYILIDLSFWHRVAMSLPRPVVNEELERKARAYFSLGNTVMTCSDVCMHAHTCTHI